MNDEIDDPVAPFPLDGGRAGDGGDSGGRIERAI